MTKLRSQIDKKYKWDLSCLYKNEQEWENDFLKLDSMVRELTKFRGKLHTIALADFLPLYENYSRTYENLLVYSYLTFSVDTSSHIARDREQRLALKGSELSSQLSFVDQELSRLKKDKFNLLKKKNKSFLRYDYFIEQYTRFEPHLLTEESEKVISSLSPVLSKSESIFETLTDTNFIFPEVIHKKKKYQITHGSVMKLLENKDRELRQKAHNSYYQPFFQFKDTIAEAYGGAVQHLNIKAKLRKFSTGRDMVLFSEELNSKVVEALLSALQKNIKVSYEYKKIRARKLGLKKLSSWDLNAPLSETEQKYSYEQIIKLTRESLLPLGEKYLEKYDNALRSKVIDVFENKYKRSGAYSWGSYNSRGFIFLNTSGKSRDISTFAHEMGHCLHRDFSIASQPYFYYGNPIVLAEVASTTNEILLLEHLLKIEKNKEKRKSISLKYISLFENTFFRQGMFADFENQVHLEVSRGKVFTEKAFTAIYEKLLGKYHGPNFTIDDYKKIEWARIPHFYRPFYVFKYATSIGVAVHFAHSILKREEGAVEKYLKFLSAGSHKPPLEVLNDSGIDLTDPQVYSPLFNKYKQLLKNI